MNVVSIDGLSVAFDGAEGRKTVVDDVSLRVPHKKTVALVGESGSGKTVISQAIMGLLPDSARITAGSIVFREPGADNGGIDIASLDPAGAKMREIRGDRIAIIFQEPMTSLSPLHTIGNQISEAVRLHRGRSGPRRARSHWRCCGWCGSPTRRAPSIPSPSNSPAACASAR